MNIAEEKKRCIEDLYYLGCNFLGYTDAEEIPHRQLCEFIQSGHKRKLLVGSRGIYKTSFGTIGRAIQLILKDPNIRILLVSNTADNASNMLKVIRQQLESNGKLRELFGDIIPENPRKVKKKWGDSKIEVNRDGIFPEPTITAAGADKQFASGHYDVILGDDTVAARKDDIRDDGVIVLRDEDVQKAVGLHRLMMQGLKILKKELEIQYILNRWGVHDFARWMMDHQIYNEDTRPNGFTFKQMAVHNEDGSLLWPDVLTEEELDQIREDQGDFIYYTQYECMPYNPANRGFPPEDNTYWEGDLPPGYQSGSKRYRRFILIDVADSLNPASCNTAMVYLFVDENNHLWVHEALRGRMDTNEKIKNIHRLVRKYNMRRVHIEENLHNDTLKYVLREAMRKESISYNVMPLKHKNRNKDARILRLQPYHQRGAIHIHKRHRELQQEMRDFGYTNLKDLLDALGYALDFVKGPPSTMQNDNFTRDPNTVYLSDIMRDMPVMKYGGGVFKSQNKLTQKEAV